MAEKRVIRMLAVSGCLGYGFTETAFEAGLTAGVDFIACDAGSMDPGPWYLGAGKPYVTEQAIRRDLEIMLVGARRKGIPVIIGSAGGGGGAAHVAILERIIREIARDRELHFRLAVIQAEPDKSIIAKRLAEGRVHPLENVPALTQSTIDNTDVVVTMMGAEPLQRALSDGADVVLAGRCSDSALFAAIPMMRGFPAGPAWHLGKTIECGGAIVRPKIGQDCVIGHLYDDGFEVEPGHPEKRCTPESVAAHTLYENPSPYDFVEPSGAVDTRDATYVALDDRRVRVTGSRYVRADRYTVKLEGVRCIGHRTVMIAGIRDSRLIEEIDSFCASLHERLAVDADNLGISPDDFTLTIRRYGVDGVLGPLEPENKDRVHEIGLVLDVVGKTPDIASAILAKARYIAMHTEFKGRLSSSGNLAMPFSPSDIPVGTAWEFSMWHAMELDDPLEIFPITMMEL